MSVRRATSPSRRTDAFGYQIAPAAVRVSIGDSHPLGIISSRTCTTASLAGLRQRANSLAMAKLPACCMGRGLLPRPGLSMGGRYPIVNSSKK